MEPHHKHKITYWIFAIGNLFCAGAWVYLALFSTRIHSPIVSWILAIGFAFLAGWEVWWYWKDKILKEFTEKTE